MSNGLADLFGGNKLRVNNANYEKYTAYKEACAKVNEKYKNNKLKVEMSNDEKGDYLIISGYGDITLFELGRNLGL
ncbi:MAG: hypothetical protein KDH96_01485 [Candidatus Riesia sp.]|nr:hypothetical protein [Candidatus Riesia sp.]